MKGISPLISLVLTVLLIAVAVSIVMTTLKPSLDRMTDSSVLTEAMQNLELINSAIKQVASESQGSRRTISLTVTDGEYKVNGTKEWIEFDYDLKSDFSMEGIIRNVRLDKSPVFIEYFNNYQENTNASPSWIIKNGTWAIETGEYSGQNGLAYYNLGKTSYFTLEGKIINKAGTGGEIFALPVSPEYLVGYWTFDEGSGNYTYDYSGFNNTGTLKNGTVTCSNGDCPTWTDGKFDYGLSFDGVDDYVNVGKDASLNITEALTVEAWIKPTGPHQGGFGGIWYRDNSNRFLVNNDGSLLAQYIIGGVSKSATSPADSAPRNVWTYVVLTYDGSEIVIYVNGVKQTPVSATGLIAQSINDRKIGWSFSDPAWYHFNGTIDEVRIYNRALTAEEIKASYELGLKKLSSTGKTDTIEATTNVSIVLSNPAGHTHFDDIKIKTNKKEMKLTIPYAQVDLNGTARFAKGNYKLTIEHKGVNTTVNKPIIELILA